MASDLVGHLKNSFVLADRLESKIDGGILSLEGMSGTKTRHFLNNLCSLPGTRYLEIGSWKGSTVCAAMCKNNATVTCVDNWSEFGGPRLMFYANFNRYIGNNVANVIEQDAFTINLSKMGKFNVYMYDGAHDDISHYKALTYFINNMDNKFVYVVDDWNWKGVRDATRRAIADLKLDILWEKEIRLTDDDTHTKDAALGKSTYHNGIFACVLGKTGQ